MTTTAQTSQSAGKTSELAPAPKNFHPSNAALAATLQVKAGVRYCLVDQQGKPVNTEKPIRIGNDLVITLQDGREVVLKGFFLAKKPAKSTASADDSTNDDAPQWLQFEAGHLVAVIEGDSQAYIQSQSVEGQSDNTLATRTVLGTEDIQAALQGAQPFTLDSTTASLLPAHSSPPLYLADASEQAGLPYLQERIADQLIADQLIADMQLVQSTPAEPLASASTQALAEPQSSFNALPYVGGALGVLVIAAAAGGGGGGGGGGSGSSGGGGGGVVVPVDNMLLVSPVLGAVLPGNDLVVWAYKVKADGTVESQPFVSDGTVGADGKAHLNVGSYTGLVKVVVRDGGNKEDFTDDASGQNVDAQEGVDLAVSYGEVQAGTNNLNLNHVTTLIAAKVEAGNNITKAALDTASVEVAAILHIPPGIKLQGDTLAAPTATTSTVDFYGLANAVLYAAEKKSPGFIQSLGGSPNQQKIDDAFRDFVLTPVGSNPVIQAAVTDQIGYAVVESPELSLVEAVVGGATHAEATAAADVGVLRVSAKSGHTVSLTFTDTLGHSLTKQITATGVLQLVTLDATDLGAGSQQLSDGNITVSATSSDAFGKPSTVRSLTFALDGSAPAAPGMELGAQASSPVSRDEALGTGLLNLKAEANSTLKVTFTDVSGHSVVRSLMGQGADAAVSLGLTAAELGTGNNQLAEGSITVTAVATDAAGNEGAASTSTFLLDYTAPAAPDVNVNPTFTDTYISKDEATAADGLIVVQAEAGSVISVEFRDHSDRPGNTVSRTLTGLGAAGVGVQLTAADLGTGTNQLQDGTITVTAKARDAAGNVSELRSFTFVLDVESPAAPRIAIPIEVADGATAAEATASGGVISITAKQGSNVRVIFSDGTHEVVKNVIGQEDTAVGVVLTAADLALFGNNYSGDIRVRAKATGLTGNSSSESSATFTLDRVAPASPELVLVSDTGTDGDGATSNPQIRISGLETAAGTRWYYREDGGDAKTGSAIAADGTSTFAATAGSHQYQVWQVDRAGNAGPVSGNINVNFQDGPLTAQIQSGRLAQLLLRGHTDTLTITFNHEIIGNTLALGDFTVSGGTLSNLQASANPLAYTAVFTPNANSSGTASVALAAGAVTNLAGVSNVSGASISLPFNTSTPASPTLTLAADVIGGATLAEATASTGIVMVQAESGTTVNVIFTDLQGHEVERDFTANGSSGVWVTLAASDLGAGQNQLSKGAIQITATAINAAGNSSDIQVKQFTFDPDPPADAVLALASGLGSVISGTRATAADGVLSLVAEAGSTVQVTLRDQSGSSVVRSFTGNGITKVWLTLAASEMGTGAGKLQDGAISVTALVTDAAGNQAASNTLSFALDNIAPTTPTLQLVDTLVSRSEALGSLLTIGTETGTQVRVTFTDRLNHTVVRDYTTGVSGSSTIALLNTELGTDSSQLADGVVTVLVTATDAAGNNSSSSNSFTLDTTPPANPVLDMGPGVTGDVSRNEALAADGVLSLVAELNSTLSVTLTDTSGHSVVRPLTGRGTTAVPLVLTAADLGGASGLADGTITVVATATDAAGNPAASSASRTFLLDSVKPGQAQLALAPEVLTGATLAEATATGAGTASAGVISVTADSGSTVRVTFSDGTSSVVRSLTGSNTAQWVTLAGSEIGTGAGKLQDGTITVTAVVSDAAGNASEASTTFTLDTVAPIAPGIGLGSGLTLGQVVSRSKALQAAGVLAVNAESGASVALTLTDSAGHQVSRQIVVGASAAALTLAAGELGTDIGKLGNGTITVRATSTDAAGNVGPLQGTFTFELDATPPSAPAIVLGNGITGEVVSGSKATQAAGVLALTAESGSQVVLTLTDRLGHQIPRTLAAGASASAITLTAAELGTDAGQLSDGSITVSAIATDAAGNSSLAGSFSFTLDTAAATPSITLGNGVTGVVSLPEAIRDGGVIRVAADAGDEVRITFTDTATPSHSVIRTITAAANALGITLLSTDLGGASGLANGPISVRAEAIDAVGNTSSAGTFSFDLDTTPTGVPSIGLGAGISGAVSRTEALLAAGVLQVQVAAADIGSWVELTLTDKLGNQIGRNFTATGTSSAITLAATDLGTVTGTLSDGNISVTARATDAAGNSSALGSFSFTLDTAVLPPTIGLGSGVTGDVSKDEALRAAGSGGVVQVTTETGSTVVLTFTPEAGHGNPVTRTVHTTGAATSVAVTLAPSEVGTGSGQLSGGLITVSAVATDAAGNTSTAGSFSFTLDIDAPAAPVVTLGAGITDIASRSKALQPSGVLLVNAETGGMLEVTLTDRLSHSVVRTVSASSASAITLAASELGTGVGQLDEGSISVSAVALDAAGNRSTAGTSSFTLDSKVAAPAITLGTGVSGDVSQAEATLASGVVQVTAESGSTVVLTFTDAQGDTVLRTVTTTSAASAVTLATSEVGSGNGKLSSGRISISAVATDAVGNVSDAGSYSFTLDLDAPTAPDISLGTGVTGDVSRSEALQAGGVIQVSAESGSTVNLTFTDGLGHSVTRSFMAGNAAGNAASAITLADSDLGTGSNQLSDGTITVSASATDATGNQSTVGSFSFRLDSKAPAAATFTYSGGVITVTGEQGSTISLTLLDAASPPNSVTRSITLAGTTTGTLGLTTQDLATLTEGLINVSSSTRDAAGNSTSGTGSFALDDSDIQVPAPNLQLTSAVVDGATSAEALAGVLEVLANSGHEITLTLTDSLNHQVTRTITAGSSASTITLAAGELGTDTGKLSDGIITVTAVAKDASQLSASSTINFNLDTKVLPPTLGLGSGVSDTVSRSEALQASGVVQVTTETGSTVVLTFTPEAGHGNPVTRTVHTTGAATSVAVTLAPSEVGTGSGQLSGGLITVSAVATDAAGNTSTAGSFSFTLDIDAPAAPVVTLGAGITDIASRSKALQPSGVLLVNAETGGMLEVTLTDRLSHSVVRTVSASSASAITLAASELGTGVGQLDEGSISVSAVALDAAGNRSTAGTSSFTLDSKVAAPAITLGTGVSGDVSQAEATLASGVVQVTAESGSTVVLTFTDAQGDTVLRTVTTTSAASAVTLATSEVGSGNGKLSSGRISISAVATDAVGNVSDAGSYSFTLDLDAPTAPDISLGTGVTGDVSRSEALQAGGVIQVSAESGSTVNLTFTDGLGHSVTRSFMAGNAAGNAASAITLADSDLGTGSNQLSDGTITVSASATDAAGNQSSAGSFSFTLDSAIATPSIGLAAGVSGDVSKNEATLASGVLQVTAESGSTVVLTLTDITGRLLNRTVTAGASASTITLATSDLGTGSGQLQDGTINVTSVATDLAGNRTTAGSFSFTLNTQAPDAPILNWGAAIGNGATLAEATSSLLGIYAQSGSTVLVTFTDTNPSHNYSVMRSLTGLGFSTAAAITLAAAELGSGINQLGDGSIQVSVTSTDAAGNSTSVTSSFQLDTTPPDYPVLTLTPDLDNGGTLLETSVASGLLGFQAESGSTVNITFTDSGGRSFSRSATGNGSSSVPVTLAASDIGGASGLADGTITVTARASDAAGNSSAFTTSSFVLDTAAPLAPVVALRTDTNLPGDGITSDSQINISGLETATGTRWRYSVDGGAAMDGGSISGTGTSTLQGQQGAHSYAIWQIDKAGNESSARTTVNYTIQALASLTVTLAQDTGAKNNDLITNQSLVQVAGIAAGSVWRYSVDGGAAIDGGTPSATGTSSFTATAGTHTYTIWQRDSSLLIAPLLR